MDQPLAQPAGGNSSKPGNDGVSLESLDSETRCLIESLQQQISLLREQLMKSAGGMESEKSVSLDEAKDKLKEAMERLMAGDESAQSDYEIWDKLVSEHPDHIAELARRDAEWDRDQEPKNLAALRITKGFIPKVLSTLSVSTLTDNGLPLELAKRIFSKKCLWLVRMKPEIVSKFHLADLRGKFTTQGLDIIELRSVYAVFPKEFDNDPTGEKLRIRQDIRRKLVTMVSNEVKGEMRAGDMRKKEYFRINADGNLEPIEGVYACNDTSEEFGCAGSTTGLESQSTSVIVSSSAEHEQSAEQFIETQILEAAKLHDSKQKPVTSSSVMKTSSRSNPFASALQGQLAARLEQQQRVANGESRKDDKNNTKTQLSSLLQRKGTDRVRSVTPSSGSSSKIFAANRPKHKIASTIADRVQAVSALMNQQSQSKLGKLGRKSPGKLEIPGPLAKAIECSHRRASQSSVRSEPSHLVSDCDRSELRAEQKSTQSKMHDLGGLGSPATVINYAVSGAPRTQVDQLDVLDVSRTHVNPGEVSCTPRTQVDHQGDVTEDGSEMDSFLGAGIQHISSVKHDRHEPVRNVAPLEDQIKREQHTAKDETTSNGETMQDLRMQVKNMTLKLQQARELGSSNTTNLLGTQIEPSIDIDEWIDVNTTVEDIAVKHSSPQSTKSTMSTTSAAAPSLLEVSVRLLEKAESMLSSFLPISSKNTSPSSYSISSLSIGTESKASNSGVNFDSTLEAEYESAMIQSRMGTAEEILTGSPQSRSSDQVIQNSTSFHKYDDDQLDAIPQCIVSHRVLDSNHSTEFLVHWHGSSRDEDEWFPESLVRKSYPKLISDYCCKLVLPGSPSRSNAPDLSWMTDEDIIEESCFGVTHDQQHHQTYASESVHSNESGLIKNIGDEKFDRLETKHKLKPRKSRSGTCSSSGGGEWQMVSDSEDGWETIGAQSPKRNPRKAPTPAPLPPERNTTTKVKSTAETNIFQDETTRASFQAQHESNGTPDKPAKSVESNAALGKRLLTNGATVIKVSDTSTNRTRVLLATENGRALRLEKPTQAETKGGLFVGTKRLLSRTRTIPLAHVTDIWEGAEPPELSTFIHHQSVETGEIVTQDRCFSIALAGRTYHFICRNPEECKLIVEGLREFVTQAKQLRRLQQQ